MPAMEQVHSRQARALVIASTLVATLALLAACDRGGATATSSSLAAADILKGSALAMAGVSSFRFALDSQGGGTPIPGGMEMTSAQGAMSKPDRMDVTVNARFSGFVVQVQVISVAGKTHMTNPLTGAWQTFESAASPVAFFDPAKGASLVLESVTQPSQLTDTASGGVEAYRIQGRLPARAVQFIAGSYVEGAILGVELWIGKADSLLRQIRLEGQITAGEAPGIVRVLTFSDFNQPFDIKPPP